MFYLRQVYRSIRPMEGKLNSGLLGLGLLSALLYWVGLAHIYPLDQGIARPRTLWAEMVDFSLAAGLRHAGVYLLLVICYVAALRLALRVGLSRLALVIVIASWLLYSLALLATYPGESFDIFDYSYRGRMLVDLGISPLAVKPSAAPRLPYYTYISWKGWVDTYGPIWEYASGMVALLSGRTLPGLLLGYRLLAMSMTLCCGGLIVIMVRRVAPGHALAALLAWIWNPGLLIATSLGAHNDIIMIFLILLSLCLFQRQRWSLGLVALLLAAHVKLTALLLVPVVGLWLVRRCGWLRAIRAGSGALMVVIGLSWLLYRPLGSWTTLPPMLRERGRFLIHSPANVVYQILQQWSGWREVDARQITSLGATVLFCLIALPLLVRLWRGPATDAALWRSGVAVTMVYLLVGSFWFQSWYLVWVLGLAALVPASRFTRTWLPLYAAGTLWGNLLSEFLYHDPGRRFDALEAGAIIAVVIVLPLVCGAALVLLRRATGFGWSGVVQQRPRPREEIL